jgi:hypothetical protein
LHAIVVREIAEAQFDETAFGGVCGDARPRGDLDHRGPPASAAVHRERREHTAIEVVQRHGAAGDNHLLASRKGAGDVVGAAE